MFDMSWGEMLLIGAAALIFIGPKELPAALRALGQMTGKVRRMAGEFRTQFDDAMRDADVQSIRKEFDSMNDTAASASSFNPLDTIRNEIKGAVEKPVDKVGDMDRPSDLMPPAVAEPAIPAPEPAAPVDVASFDVSPTAPAPVVAAAPQPPAAEAPPAPGAPAAPPPKPAPAAAPARPIADIVPFRRPATKEGA